MATEQQQQQQQRESDRQDQASPAANEPSATAVVASKKKFNLRDELSEVQQLLDGSLPADQQVEAIHKKYMGLVRDYKRLERRLVDCQKKQLEVAQHRDIIQTECARLNVAKSKLETLCRELQKHNKQVVEDSKQRGKAEESKRREVTDRFQSTIADVTTKMQEQQQENLALKQENIEITGKLKQLLDQFEEREKQFDQAVKHSQLELQLLEAKLAQQSVAMAEARENSLAERQFLLSETLEQQKHCEELTSRETDLRRQLVMYSEKFEEFQKTLTKSSELFAMFKKETDKMNKTISRLEKENAQLKTRNDKCNRSLLEMAEERLKEREIAKGLTVKNERLESLCRALQTERSDLNKQLKEAVKDKDKEDDDTTNTE